MTIVRVSVPDDGQITVRLTDPMAQRSIYNQAMIKPCANRSDDPHMYYLMVCVDRKCAGRCGGASVTAAVH